MNKHNNSGWIWYPVFFLLLFPVIFGLAINGLWWCLADTWMIWPIWVSLGLVASFTLFGFIQDFAGVNLDNDEIALITYAVNPKRTTGGYSKYDLLESGGWHWTKPTRHTVTRFDLTDKIEIPFDFTLSAKDDDPTVSGTVLILPDPKNPDKLLREGRDKGKRESNLRALVGTEVVQRIEDKCSKGKTVDEVIQESGKIANKVHEEWVESGEPAEHGFILVNVKIGNVDYSKEVSKARNDKKVIGILVDSAEELKRVNEDGKPGNLTAKERVNAAMAKTGEVKKTVFEVEGSSAKALETILEKVLTKVLGS